MNTQREQPKRPRIDISQDILEAAKRGDQEALAQIIRMTQGDVYTLALRLVGNPEDALDVTQETYLRALRGLSKFRGDSAFSTWLYRVTANTAYSYKAKARKRRTEPFSDADVERETAFSSNDPSPERAAIASIAYEDVIRGLERLPAGSRTVVVLKDVYGFTHEEIADALGISVTACKVRLFRARQRLKDLLTSKGSAAASR
jgi:RNA polymerase sigma factor (sigma-70 family)